MMSEEDKKKLNEELVEYVGKRKSNEAPRYVARLKSYVDLQYKRRRAGAARRHYHGKKDSSATRKKTDGDVKDKTMENTEHLGEDGCRVRRSRHDGETRSRSGEPCDRCGGRRRRRRRRRSCGRRRKRRRRRRRRRRRSCGRKKRKRRRRSCSRRRRRRSCRRRRRKRRRRRRC